ncbi:MAG TPA: YggT family protein [Miltoncostaeales bacterium]|jgi:YggT family protein|nr:YggT family protein [Miltoncostaeales bacterium]
MDRFISTVSNLFTVFGICVLIRILLSWVPFSPMSRTAQAVLDFFRDTTEWYLGFFRRFIPMAGPIDLSPMAALLVLAVAKRFVVDILLQIG